MFLIKHGPIASSFTTHNPSITVPPLSQVLWSYLWEVLVLKESLNLVSGLGEGLSGLSLKRPSHMLPAQEQEICLI